DRTYRAAYPGCLGRPGGSGTPEGLPERSGHLTGSSHDLVPSEVHDLEAGRPQLPAPLELGHGLGRARVLHGPVRLTDRPVAPPQEVGAAEPPVIPADQLLQLGRWNPLLAEGDPRDRLQ